MDEKDFDKKMFDICYSQDEFNKELGRAKNGNVEAQYYVGIYYATKKHFNDAFYWLMKAAQQNNSDAQCEIGNCYANGIGTSANVNEAFYWWIKSANAGNREAQFKAGLCYGRGIGVDKNPELASKLLMTSASQGYQPAQEFIYKINETMNRK